MSRIFFVEFAILSKALHVGVRTHGLPLVASPDGPGALMRRR